MSLTSELRSSRPATSALKNPLQRRAGPLTLDVVRSVEEFHALEPWWDLLVESCATRSPFLRWDYVRLWWEECRESDAQLAIGVLRDVEGVPQAIAPLMLTSVRESGRRHLRHLTFLAGVGHAHGERLDFIVPEGRESEMMPQLGRVFACLRGECDTVRLNHLPEESPTVPHVCAALEQHFEGTCVLNRNVCRKIQLPATWDEFEKRQSANWRSKIRRCSRAFTGERGGRLLFGGLDMPVEQSLDVLRHLHGLHWAPGVSTFLEDHSWSFHQRLVRHWMPGGRICMPLLAAEDRPTAVLYGLVERGEFFMYQMGWDQAFARFSMGHLIISRSVDHTIRRGLSTFDMLPGDYEYKTHWCESARWLLDLEAHNPRSWKALAFRTLRAARRLARGSTTTPVDPS